MFYLSFPNVVTATIHFLRRYLMEFFRATLRTCKSLVYTHMVCAATRTVMTMAMAVPIMAALGVQVCPSTALI